MLIYSKVKSWLKYCHLKVRICVIFKIYLLGVSMENINRI